MICTVFVHKRLSGRSIQIKALLIHGPMADIRLFLFELHNHFWK